MNPYFRRRRRSDLASGLGASLIGAATSMAAGASLIGATASTGSGALIGAGATTGSAAALMGATGTTGSGAALRGVTAGTGSGVIADVAGTASWTGGFVFAGTGLTGVAAWVAVPPAVSSCNFALAGLIGAGTTGVAGTAS
jgi:hypothetical protein